MDDPTVRTPGSVGRFAMYSKQADAPAPANPPVTAASISKAISKAVIVPRKIETEAERLKAVSAYRKKQVEIKRARELEVRNKKRSRRKK